MCAWHYARVWVRSRALLLLVFVRARAAAWHCCCYFHFHAPVAAHLFATGARVFVLNFGFE
jgi:hypothetical protein